MNTAQQILDLAEMAIATKGYSAFSFRELAADLGIKSASVHYHYPTKVHLGLAVAERYRQRLADALQCIAEEKDEPRAALEGLIAIYRHEARSSQRMSVCMMLAAEIKQLPTDIQREITAFYQLNIEWLQKLVQRQCPQLNGVQVQTLARQIFALLQGALMGAKTQNSPDYFDSVIVAIDRLWPQ